MAISLDVIIASPAQSLAIVGMVWGALWLMWPRRRPQANATSRSKHAAHGNGRVTPVTDAPAMGPTAFETVVTSHQAAFAKVASFIETSGTRVHGVHRASLAASRHIDNAEMAFLRLIDEVSDYLPEPRHMPAASPRRA